MTKAPEISDGLIAYLEQIFPDRVVDPSNEDPSVAYGSALVVRHLKQKHQEQSETIYVRP